MSDLFGADLPVEGAETAEFAWRDGSLLQALRAGHWILLDEVSYFSSALDYSVHSRNKQKQGPDLKKGYFFLQNALYKHKTYTKNSKILFVENKSRKRCM